MCRVGRQCVGIPSSFFPMLVSLMVMSVSHSEKSPSEPLDVYTDGASRGNPGPAAYGFIFVKNNEIIFEDSRTIGKTTNNTAEYYAIISALIQTRIGPRFIVSVPIPYPESPVKRSVSVRVEKSFKLSPVCQNSHDFEGSHEAGTKGPEIEANPRDRQISVSTHFSPSKRC